MAYAGTNHNPLCQSPSRVVHGNLQPRTPDSMVQSGGMHPSFCDALAAAASDTRITATEFRVLAIVGNGVCVRASIAKTCGVSVPTIARAIAKLVSLGLLLRQIVPGKASVLSLPTRIMGDTATPVTRIIHDTTRGADAATRITSDPATHITDDTPLHVVSTAPKQTTTDRSITGDTGVDNPPLVPPSSFPPIPPLITTPLNPPSDLFGSNEPQRSACSISQKPKAAKPRTEYTPEFEAIWKMWPAGRRANSDKRTAFKRFQTGAAQFGADKIEAAAKRYLALPSTRKEDFQYCCLVEVFMNGKLEAAIEALGNPAAPPSAPPGYTFAGIGPDGKARYNKDQRLNFYR